MADDLEQQYSQEENEVDPRQALLDQYQASKTAQDEAESQSPLADREQMLGQDVAPSEPSEPQSISDASEQNVYGNQLADRKAMLGQDTNEPTSSVSPPSPMDTEEKSPDTDIKKQLQQQLADQSANATRYQQILDAANQSKHQQDLTTTLAMAGAQIGHGFAAGAGGNAQVDYTPYKQLNKMTDDELTAAQKKVQLSQMSDQQKSSMLKEIANQQQQNELSEYRKAQETRLEKQEDFAEQKIKSELDIKNQENTPGSDLNTATAARLKALFPEYVGKMDLSNASYKELQDTAKLIEQRTGIDTKKDMAKIKADQMKYSADLLAQYRQQKAESDKAKADQKQQDTFAKNDADVAKQMVAPRGNRALQQAQLNMLSADNARSLLKGKDLDKLTNQDIQLLNSEIAKIATGGVPTESGVQHLLSPTLEKKAAEFTQFLSNNPTPAMAGAFLKKNKQYLDELYNNSANKVSDYQENILKANKGRLTPEAYERQAQDNKIFQYRTYSPEKEAGIANFMEKNNITDRNEAIQQLRKADKL